jgi:TPP-dependent pyruvate/acetoin dehydrogenase alpha subunit
LQFSPSFGSGSQTPLNHSEQANPGAQVKVGAQFSPSAGMAEHLKLKHHPEVH